MVEGQILAVMREIRASGGISPYYGAGGSRGICVYQFRPSPFGYTVRVEHNATSEKYDSDDEQVAASTLAAIGGYRLTGFRDRVQQLFGRRNSQSITLSPNQSFVIAGRDYQALCKWPFWDEKAAFQQRYIYRFGQVSLGATGYTVRIEDITSGQVIDVSDYEFWQ